jgi:hypothetical protein
MGEFEVWVYRGAIIALLGVLWYLSKGVLKELRMIRSSLQLQEIAQVRQDEKVNTANSRIENHDHRLNDHAIRIREVERKQDSCTYCKEQ